jgi:uncharacterized membrane protein YgcG
MRRIGACVRSREEVWMSNNLRKAMVLLASVGALTATTRCNCAVDLGFECGKALDGDQDTIRRCGADHEVCICATNACARKHEACPSGFRYVAAPFAKRCVDGTDDCIEGDAGTDGGSERIASECVPTGDVAWRIDPGSDQPRCGDVPPADGGVEAGEDGETTSTSASSGMNGSSSSAGTGSSGAGGSDGGIQ